MKLPRKNIVTLRRRNLVVSLRLWPSDGRKGVPFKTRFASGRAVVAVICFGSLLEEGRPGEGGWGQGREWRMAEVMRIEWRDVWVTNGRKNEDRSKRFKE